jgi:hypothetical protein
MATHADLQALKGVKEEYEYGFHDEENAVFRTERGLTHAVIDQISDHKNEPAWMREFRHKALDIFLAKPMPTWGADLSGIDFDEITYYLKPSAARRTTGTTCRRTSSAPSTAWASRGGAQVPGRRRRAV